MIEKPYFWLGVPIKGDPQPWREYRWRYGLMPNAYEILSSPRLDESVRKHGISRFLDFQGNIAIDSGGYQFLYQLSTSIRPDDVLELYRNCKPDFGVVLDHPISPGLSLQRRRTRQAETLANTRYMISHRVSRSPVLIPVIHGHHPITLGVYIKKLMSICDPPVIAIGSVVPSIFSTTGAATSYQAIRALAFIRRKLPDKVLHVFGVGSIMTMHLMYYAGIDSVDSSAWRIKAAYGAIQLPGICDRNVTGKSAKAKYKRLSKKERQVLDSCRCPICRAEGIAHLKKSFQARAIHNSWVYQSEVDLVRRLMRSGEYERYVERTLSSNPRFSKILTVLKNYKSKGSPVSLVN